MGKSAFKRGIRRHLKRKVFMAVVGHVLCEKKTQKLK